MKKFRNILLIGAGNIGSRHLQGLKKVNFPLNIQVVDPSSKSLKIAKERFDQIPSKINHIIAFKKALDPYYNNIDMALIATNSNIRKKILENLLNKCKVKYLILEKILFNKKADYLNAEKILRSTGTKTWVDFSMRTMPFYRDLKSRVKGPIQMIVSGGQYGLVTNAIHFIDYISYLTGKSDFTVDTSALDPRIIRSKRKGFLEINGTLTINFKDGSTGLFSCYPNNNAPFLIELHSKNFRCISKETERKCWISESESNWTWAEENSNLPYQSEMTNVLVENILKKGNSNLATYEQASKTHVIFLEALVKFLNIKSKKKFNYYPFT